MLAYGLRGIQSQTSLLLSLVPTECFAHENSSREVWAGRAWTQLEKVVKPDMWEVGNFFRPYRVPLPIPANIPGLPVLSHPPAPVPLECGQLPPRSTKKCDERRGKLEVRLHCHSSR